MGEMSADQGVVVMMIVRKRRVEGTGKMSTYQEVVMVIEDAPGDDENECR